MTPDGIVAALRAERQRQGLSQGEVARRLSTSTPIVCKWERGTHSPSLHRAVEWAAALGLQVSLSPVTPDQP